MRYCIFLWLLWYGHAVHGSIEYKSGLGSSFDASYPKRITVASYLDTNGKLVTFSGSTPDATTTTYLINQGFSKMLIAWFDSSDGTLDTSFHSGNGYHELNKTVLAGSDVNYSSVTNPQFLPGVIIQDSSGNYFAFASVRQLTATGSGYSRIFMTKFETDGDMDTTMNSGGSKNLTDGSIIGAYGVASGNALYTINKAIQIPGTDRAIVVGSILQDPESAQSFTAKGFIMLVDLTSNGSILECKILSGGSAIELLSVAINGTEVYACGYNGSNATVANYDYVSAGNGGAGGNEYLVLSDGNNGTTNFGTSGVYISGTSNTKAWDVKVQSGGDIIVSIVNATTSPGQTETASVIRLLASDGTEDSSFGTSGTTTHSFALTTDYPYMLKTSVGGGYAFKKTHQTIQLIPSGGSQDYILVCGTLADYCLPYIWYLDNDGVEQNFAYNDYFSTDLISGLQYPTFSKSPTFFINNSSVSPWIQTLHTVLTSTIDSDGILYVAGSSGAIQKAGATAAISSYTSSSDYFIKFDPTIDISSFFYQQPVWSTGEVYVNIQNNFIYNTQSDLSVESWYDLATTTGLTLSDINLTSAPTTAPELPASGIVILLGEVYVTKDSISTLVPLQGYIYYDVDTDGTLISITPGKLFGQYQNGYIVLTTQPGADSKNILPSEATVSAQFQFEIDHTSDSSSCTITAAPDALTTPTNVTPGYSIGVITSTVISQTFTQSGMYKILVSATIPVTLSDGTTIAYTTVNGYLPIVVNQDFSIKTPQSFLLRGTYPDDGNSGTITCRFFVTDTTVI